MSPSTNYTAPGSTQLGYKFETYASVGDTTLTAATNTNLCTIYIPPGVWLVTGNLYCLNGANAQTNV